jgi:chemotaxis protein methyltransferase CheR
MNNMTLTDHLFEQFSDLVYRECGINLHSGKKSLLQARLNKRLRATGIKNYDTYYDFLISKEDPREIVSFLDCISTNLTYFFREQQHFDFFNKILSDLIPAGSRHQDKRIRIWSAGCSTGEEPYSIAMCIASHISDVNSCDLKILATDISTRVLAVAKQGIYGDDKLKSLNSHLINKYFKKVNGTSGKYEVNPLLKKIITFSRLNLKEQYPFKGPFDIVFCRNVMIYFDKQTQEHLVNRIASYLAPGGYLFVGHSESLMGLNHELSYVKPAVYRK